MILGRYFLTDKLALNVQYMQVYFLDKFEGDFFDAEASGFGIGVSVRW